MSLPFGHSSLKELDQFKKNFGQRIEKKFWAEKEKLLEFEKKSIKNCPRLDFLNNILLQKPKIVDLNCIKFDRNTEFLYKEQRQLSILDFILSAGWKEKNTENSLTTDSSVKTSSLFVEKPLLFKN